MAFVDELLKKSKAANKPLFFVKVKVNVLLMQHQKL